ncbi:HNH endonuclease signature motif containing protein [Microbacterium sp. A93]|uniref:HNH endonuclease signature motif containing protein n=1 Tax=Microbacterium sp. A93 TaxID=3450716 RepID=UPI003F4288FE
MHDAALRPRRGGPRFVDSDERAAAKDLSDDPRTNEQLAHDLMTDVLRAGALADAKTVFGTRQAGVRLVQTVETNGAHGPAHTEDGLAFIPSSVADQHACNTGTIPVIVDSCGNPLDVGREQRLFTTKQRIALAVRDGGCRWKGCDRPASYCESHHIDHWVDGGCTDLDRGILLCRFHHLQLHNGGWSISRDPGGEFMLRHPSGDGVLLVRRLALRYAFEDIDLSPRRFRPAS